MCLVERVSVNKTTIPLINISIFHVSMGILGGGERTFSYHAQNFWSESLDGCVMREDTQRTPFVILLSL